MSWLRKFASNASTGGGRVDVPVLLAPMAGVNDLAFRQLCVECGVDLTYTEMVSSKALSFANEKTRHLLDRAPNEKRVAVQLFGHEPQTMAREAAWVEEQMGDALAYIDINMGCPARKIVKKGDGSALLKTPDTACDIVRQVSAAVEHPVTVKFRKGYHEGEDVAVEFARRIEDAGAAAAAVHGRTAAQFYSGTADWDVVARVKQAVAIPVIGNGDVRSGSDAVALVERTGCDAVMVGRAAQGDPWLFARVKAALQGGEEPALPTVEERVAMAHRHAEILSQRIGNNLVYMRKHVMWYLHGIPGAARARGELNGCVTLADFDRVLESLLEDRARIEAQEAEYLERGFE
ncbi:tRNA dihydrouridine synthase DusB [uncultured Slackia sp.]|uniref:tRNA dihydrouridine synthase DusB n=1 Tax=uncultured Slackia sp. TaxID=665903 RepID=UPI0026DF6A38|nr:tRNA dihydrouridine synthase DusB [uncultured Slackia sp.]